MPSLFKKPVAGPYQAAAAPSQLSLQQKLSAPSKAPSGANIGMEGGDYEGILAKYAGSVNDPLYAGWKAALDAGQLTGSPQWEFSNYAEVKKGEDALAKQAEIEKQMASAGYGQMENQVQGALQGAGMAKSGFGGEAMQNLSASENLTFSDIHNRMLTMQQDFRNQAQNRWQEESFMRKADREQKKNRRFQIASAGLGAAAGILGGPLAGAGASAALNQV
jgi:hypothetical protein